MNRILLVIATGVALSISPALAEAPKPPTTPTPPTTCANGTDATGKCKPAVNLGNPGGQQPTGQATNFAFIAPIVGGVLGIGALAAGGGGNAGATPSTTN